MHRRLIVAVLVVATTVTGAAAAMLASQGGGDRPDAVGVPGAGASPGAGVVPGVALDPEDECNLGLIEDVIDCKGAALRDLSRIDPVAAVDAYHALAEQSPRLREACHGLFHDIGYGAADGERSFWEALVAGTSECNWGYVHGAVERALAVDVDEIVASAVELCRPPDWVDGDDDYIKSAAGNCIHGTGHALVRATDDPVVAERGCRDAFSDQLDTVNCIDGLIMEVGNRSEPGSDRYVGLCLDIGEDAKSTCYRNIPLTWLHANGYDFDAAFDQCQEAAPAAVLLERCGAGVAGIYTFSKSFDFAALTATCQAQPEHVELGCYIGVVQSGNQAVYSGATTQAEFDAFLAAVPDDLRVRVDEELALATAGLGVPSPSAGMDPDA